MPRGEKAENLRRHASWKARGWAREARNIIEPAIEPEVRMSHRGGRKEPEKRKTRSPARFSRAFPWALTIVAMILVGVMVFALLSH